MQPHPRLAPASARNLGALALPRQGLPADAAASTLFSCPFHRLPTNVISIPLDVFDVFDYLFSHFSCYPHPHHFVVNSQFFERDELFLNKTSINQNARAQLSEHFIT
jgi:hypothetical protein